MDDTVVTAMIGGELKGTTTVMDGMYTLPVNAGAGTEISFMVGEMSVMEKGSWMQGGATMIDLIASSPQAAEVTLEENEVATEPQNGLAET